MNANNAGVYGPDDVPWPIQQGRDEEAEAHYRKCKEEIDARDRLAAKKELLWAHEADGYIYQDSDNILHVGYEKNGATYVFGIVNIGEQTLCFTPLIKSSRLLVRWAPFLQWPLRQFTMTAPKGCI